jgi:diaminopimelate epimerase
VERGYKYHGLGNDFLVLDRRQTSQDIDAATARTLCDRHRGIGADGVLVLLPAADAAARMVVHNADGTEAESCGNGIRCVVKHLVDCAGLEPSAVRIATAAGVVLCSAQREDGAVTEVDVEMGRADWVAPNLPSGATRKPFIDDLLPGRSDIRGTAVSVGNPHLVLFGRPLEEAPRLGAALEWTAGFVERTNVEWVSQEGDAFRTVVWERGVGLTQACGTGACAVAAVAVRTHRAAAGRWIPIDLPGGRLHVCVTEAGDAELQLSMRGPATFVFEAVL